MRALLFCVIVFGKYSFLYSPKRMQKEKKTETRGWGLGAGRESVEKKKKRRRKESEQKEEEEAQQQQQYERRTNCLLAILGRRPCARAYTR